jgi:hypothetical protein
VGRGKAQHSLDLIDAAYEILGEIQPAGVRAGCYQLFIQKLLASMAKTCTNSISRLLVYAREQGIVPWEWVVDETREISRRSAWSDPDHYIRTVQAAYRRDFWDQQPRRVEVWCEKATIRGTLTPIRDTWGVGIRVMHGYGSATALHDAAEESARDNQGARLLVLYAGDWDPSGLHMSEKDIPGRLERYGGLIEFERIALLPEDIAVPTLPSFDVETKKKDRRYAWFVANYGRRCWELDALSPAVLRQRIETRIAEVIDWEAWERCERVQAAEKASLQTILNTWKGASA